MLFENVAGKRYRDARCRFLAARALCTTVPHHLDLGSHACFYVGARSSRSRGLVSPQRELRCASIAPGGFLAPHRDPDAASINERFGSISAIPAAAFVQREAALQGHSAAHPPGFHLPLPHPRGHSPVARLPAAGETGQSVQLSWPFVSPPATVAAPRSARPERGPCPVPSLHRCSYRHAGGSEFFRARAIAGRPRAFRGASHHSAACRGCPTWVGPEIYIACP